MREAAIDTMCDKADVKVMHVTEEDEMGDGECLKSANQEGPPRKE